MVKRKGLLLIFLSLLMAVGAAIVANKWVIARVIPDQEEAESSAHVVAAAMSRDKRTSTTPLRLAIFLCS